jgi:hypothetical protein
MVVEGKMRKRRRRRRGGSDDWAPCGSAHAVPSASAVAEALPEHQRQSHWRSSFSHPFQQVEKAGQMVAAPA